ncbi:MAG: heat-inducible transcriptional repressor HrcA [Chitinispirillaceae bacterium]
MNMESRKNLSDREERILQTIVRNYILSANPTSSRFIAKQPGFSLSAATVRNVMGDLEEKGFITHPHTSAGRVPTDKGYRYYVDNVMDCEYLTPELQSGIKKELKLIDPSDLHMVMEATSRALSKATRQLGIILAPRLHSAVFRHVYIHEIGGGRFLMNLTIDSGFVKTVVVEIRSQVDPQQLSLVCQLINERFQGMTLLDMCKAGDQAFSDIEKCQLGVIRLFVPSIKRLIAESDSEEIYTQGETNILLQPEFFDKEKVGAIIEILEEKNLLMHLVDTQSCESGRVIVSIGGEIENGQFSSFSIVKTKYQIGNMEGSLGVIGPKRMPYPLLVSAVDYTARTLDELYS